MRIKLILLALLAVFLVTSCNKIDTSENNTEVIEVTDLNENIVISDNLFDLEIAIDGVKYKFPEQMDKLVDAGWVISELQDIDNMTKEDKFETGLAYIHKNYPNVTTYFKFDSKNDNKETVGMNMSLNSLTDTYKVYPDIKLAKGITFGTSLEDVRKLLGEPYGIWITEDYYILPYEDKDAGVHITFSITESFGVVGIDFYKVREAGYK